MSGGEKKKGGPFLASLDSLSTFCSTSSQVHTSGVPPHRPPQLSQNFEDSARRYYARSGTLNSKEINSRSPPGELKELRHRPEECERACITVEAPRRDCCKVLTPWKWARGLQHALTCPLAKEDIDCLATQVVRSNLQALHAFSGTCITGSMDTCKNRVCRQKSRLLGRAQRRLGAQEHHNFLLAFSQMLDEIQGDGSGLTSAVQNVQTLLKGHPRLDREFQRLVTLYSSEHGYLPSNGLDFSRSPYNPPGLTMKSEELRTRSQALQSKLSRVGLKIGRFEDVVSWIATNGRKRHLPLFTYVYCAASLIIFAFMAGAYPSYLLEHSADATKTLENYRGSSNPKGLASWVSVGQDRNFAFEYLLHWGGRYGPALDMGESWRWFTSPFIHQSFQHVIANTFLLVAFAGYSEYKHGTWRAMLVFFVTSLGGNILSACCEDPCILVVGASGIVFGFMGFYIADSIMNFETITKPLLRITIILGFSVFFAFTVFSSKMDSYVSHFSHIGGFLCGIFPSFLIIPNIKQRSCSSAEQLADMLAIQCKSPQRSSGFGFFQKREVWEQSVWSQYRFHPFACVGLVVLIVFFFAFPLYLYTNQLPNTDCIGSQQLVDNAGVQGTWLTS